MKTAFNTACVHRGALITLDTCEQDLCNVAERTVCVCVWEGGGGDLFHC